MPRRITYKLLKPKVEPKTPEELLSEENYKEEGSYPAAEFDDLSEFFIFLREAGFELRENDQLVSIYEDQGKKYMAFYVLFSSVNSHLIKSTVPKDIKSGYLLIRKIEV